MAKELSALLRQGGIYYDLPGRQPKEALAALVNAVPPAANKEQLLKAVLEREELMPTAMGNGIALPHPRNPVITDEASQFAALAFTKTPIDWGALDGKSITAIMLIVSASAKLHLSSLQRITFFCRDEGFARLLERCAPAEEILGYIEKTESAWTEH
ncbi:hypothetical protein AGMMS50230_03960 [Spirochaetia bacterium]|nr:hypothetical protein AGMMS50230_03960 [Spirochaetia bacterium]